MAFEFFKFKKENEAAGAAECEDLVEEKENDWITWKPEVGKEVLVKRTDGKIEPGWKVLDSFYSGNDQMIIVTKSGDNNDPKDTLLKKVPRKILEKINDKQGLDFSLADNFDDLYELINYQNGLRDNSQDFLPEILINMIKRVRAGELDLNRITEVNNLRQAVKNILEKEEDKKLEKEEDER